MRQPCGSNQLDMDPLERRLCLISSRGFDRRRATSDHAHKYADIPAGQTVTLGRIEGRGRIVRLWLTLPVIGHSSVLKNAVLRMFWDGETAPSVEVPLGDFFGASFGKPRRLVSDRILIVGGAYLSRFAMPFHESAVIEIANESGRTLRALFFQIAYYEEPNRQEREPTFHAQYRQQRRTKPGEPFVALQAKGRGRLAGVKIDMQSRAWWLKPPLRHIPLPRGFGLGVLEGWETITVDDDRAAGMSGTGGEDYFLGGFYFQGAPFCTPTHGCTHRSYFTGRVSAYRFHVDDPIDFGKSIYFALDHGLHNSMEADFRSVAYWYQHEPHDPFPSLPPVAERRPLVPVSNPAQWLLFAIFFIMPAVVLLHMWSN
jgi:Protein of unknown function (DUF2961)